MGVRRGAGWTIKAGCLAVAALVVSPAQTVAAGAGSAAYTAGTQAYGEGKVEVAVAQFEHARKLGYDKPELHQALGSAYMRLGRLDDAEGQFRRLSRNAQWAPLGYYNLAAVAIAREDKAQAARWYQQAYQTSSNETLRKQAAMQLTQLGEQPRERRGSFNVSVNAGFDTNLTVSGIEEDLVDIEAGEDEFLDYAGTAAVRLWGNTRHGARLIGSALYRDYMTVNRFDQGVARGGLVYNRPIGPVQGEAGVMAESIVLDGSQAQAGAIAYGQGVYPVTARQSVRGRYEVQRLEGGNDFEQLTGWQHQGIGEYLISWSKVAVAAGVRYEYNDRDDRERDMVVPVEDCNLLGCTTVDVLLEEFSSFSPVRTAGFARVVWQPEFGWTFRLEGDYQDSDYRDDDTVSANGVELVREGRKEHRTTVSVGGEKRIGRHWAVTGDYSYTKNTANLEAYDYERNLVRFGVGFLY